MNKFTIEELKEMILNNLEKKIKKKTPPKVKEEKKKIENLDDFHLNFGLKYFEPTKIIEPTKEKENNTDWFDIGSGHSKVQSVLIPKKYFTKEKAINYIVKHFKYKKIDETPKYYRFRQFRPNKNSNYSSKKLKNGVILVIEYPNEQGGSLSVQDFQKFISNSYKPVHDEIGDFQLVDSISDNEVQVFKNDKIKQLVIVFRGTEGTLRDWSNNFKMGIGRYKSTERFQRSKKIFEDALRMFPHYSITLVSHSQSGMITHLLDDERVHEVLTYNPAWFPTTKQKENERIIKTRGDPVSIAVRKNPNNTVFSTNSYNPIYNHLPEALDFLPKNQILGL